MQEVLKTNKKAKSMFTMPDKRNKAPVSLGILNSEIQQKTDIQQNLTFIKLHNIAFNVLYLVV